MTPHRFVFLVGKFLTTCATLQIEVLCSRLLWRLPCWSSVAAGDLMATLTLLALCCITATYVAGVVLVPLLRVGPLRMAASAFAASVLYFLLIGVGFMFVQIPLLLAAAADALLYLPLWVIKRT